MRFHVSIVDYSFILSGLIQLWMIFVYVVVDYQYRLISLSIWSAFFPWQKYIYAIGNLIHHALAAKNIFNHHMITTCLLLDLAWETFFHIPQVMFSAYISSFWFRLWCIICLNNSWDLFLLALRIYIGWGFLPRCLSNCLRSPDILPWYHICMRGSLLDGIKSHISVVYCFFSGLVVMYIYLAGEREAWKSSHPRYVWKSAIV